MDVVPVFRILWERRILVALGVIAAVAVGLLAGRAMAGRDVAPQVGFGTARLMLDTANSQLVASAPAEADTLAMRAELLADTMATNAGITTVARNAGVDPKDLAILVPASTAAPRVETPLVQQLVKKVGTPQAPKLVNFIADGDSPIITIQAYAADNDAVRRLTDAAVAGLRSQLLAKGGGGGGGFVLDTVVAPRIEKLPRSSHAAVGVVAAPIVTFVAWCLGVVLAVALWRRWRGLGKRDGHTQSTLLGPAPRRTALVILGASLLIAILGTTASVSRISGFPPHLERRNMQTAGAVTYVLVDLKRSGITDRSAKWPYFNRLSKRADVFAHMIATEPVLAYVARRAGIPADRIAAVAPIGMRAVDALTEPGSEAEARNLVLARKPYRLEIQSDQGSPIVNVYAPAPTPEEAQRLATAATAGVRDYFDAVSAKTSIPRLPSDAPIDPYAGGDQTNPLTLTELGSPRDIALAARADMKVAVLTFPVASGVALACLLGIAALRSRRRAMRYPTLTAAVAPPRGVPVREPVGASALKAGWSAIARSRATTIAGDWPRTSRLLPWMLAGFMVMLWLVPFDSIKLEIPSPIDLLLDRLLLPILVGTWALLLLIGGRWAPRLWLSWVHVAVGGFVVVAFLSVILSAASLNHTLEFDTALKKLPLMLSYPAVFLVFVSVVRRTEVAAFMKLTLVLAVLCALGMYWEDHFSHNLFFDWSDKLLPAVFHVGAGNAGWDTMGRRFIHGPTAHPLVAAGMLSMAFPIAVLGVIQGQRPKQRILYGLAGAVLMIGVFSTERKTGMVAPATALVTLAYFRRRQLLRLAPLGVLGMGVLLIAAPGFLMPVINQFKPGNLGGADTVNDRASDYDAIRPDFLSHVALGRGFGTYDPVGHRILDSQVLGTMIETGAIGLVAFLCLGITVLWSARHTIHARNPAWAPSALAGAAAAVVFVVLAFLFDSLSFPQLPYLFMCIAALVVVVVREPQEQPSAEAPPTSPGREDAPVPVRRSSDAPATGIPVLTGGPR